MDKKLMSSVSDLTLLSTCFLDIIESTLKTIAQLIQ